MDEDWLAVSFLINGLDQCILFSSLEEVSDHRTAAAFIDRDVLVTEI